MTPGPRLRRIFDWVIFVATHYTWAFVIVMTITLVSCAFSIHYLSSLEASLQDVYENDVRGGDAIQSAYVGLLGIESAIQDMILFPEPKARDRAKAVVHAEVATVKASLARAYPRFYTPKARLSMDATLDDLRGFFSILDRTEALAVSPSGLTPGDLGPLKERIGVLERDFDLLLANREANSHRGISELVGQLRFSLIFTVGFVVITVVVRFILYLAGHPALKKKKGL